jgi:bacteriorhodopsin
MNISERQEIKVSLSNMIRFRTELTHESRWIVIAVWSILMLVILVTPLASSRSYERDISMFITLSVWSLFAHVPLLSVVGITQRPTEQ